MKNNFTSDCTQIVVCVLFLLLPFIATAQCGALTATVSANESRCAATGSIEINASGGLGTGTYQYSISSGPVTTSFGSLSTINGLPPGNYTVVIKDVTAGCTITRSNIIITGDYVSPGIFYNSTDPTCMNENDGTIFVTSQTGGRAPFSYEIISPSPSNIGTVSTTGTFTGLTPGLYYIQMTDSCGGIQTRSQLIKSYTWSVSSSSVNNTCDNITVDISLTNSNGVNSPNAVYAGFQYGVSVSAGDTTWFSSVPFTYNIGGLRTARIFIKDNCGNIQSFPWTENKPTVNASVSTSNRTCTSFTATVTGQTNMNASMTEYCLYDQSNAILISPCQSSPVFNNLPTGTYTIRIHESCYDTTILRTVTATKPVPSVGNTPQYTYSCEAYSVAITGQINIITAIYCLYRNGNPVPDTCNSTGIFDDLIYTEPYCIEVHATDICFDTIIRRCFTVNKQQPSASASVTISNTTCSSFSATVKGQTNLTNPIYKLFNSTNDTQIGPDQTSPVFSSLAYGSYCIQVKNDSICYDTTIVICFTQSAPATMDISVSSKGICSMLGATAVKVNFNAGIAPFVSQLFSPEGILLNTASSNKTSYTFNNMPALPTGQLYKVVTTDACGNKDSGTVVSNIYYINRDITTTPRCPSGTSPNGTSDVTIKAMENRGGTFTNAIIKKNGVSFNLNPTTTVHSGGTHTYTYSSLLPATYIFDTYSQSCNTHVYDTVIVTSYVYPNLSYSTGYLCDNSSQSVNAITSGGLAPFQYQIFGSIPSSPAINTIYQSSPIFTINNGTPYTLIRLRVLDACANASINDVGFISVATPAINASNICLNAPTLLSIDSVPNATYYWYKRTYNPTDSILLDSGSVLNIQTLHIADTGTYITRTIFNGGCAERVSYLTLIPGTASCMILPMKIENLTAVRKNNYSLLNWATFNEYNINSYTIERSSDNGISWLPIGDVIAQYNSSIKNNYSFTDMSPQNDVNLYRLQLKDKNGSFIYSNIVKLEMPKEAALVVYPNPVKNKGVLNIQSKGFESGLYSVNIISSNGQSMMKTSMTVNNSGANLFTIPISNMPEGTYRIIIKGNTQQYSKTIFVQNGTR